MKRKLAIIGASYLQLPLVLKARDLGVETHCFAWEDGAVCKTYCDFFHPVSVVDKEAILKICLDNQITAITSIASDVAVNTVCYIAQHAGLISNSIDSARCSTDKHLMRQKMTDNQVNCPRFALIKEADDVADFRFPVIVKPTDRSGSLGVQKVLNHAGLNDAIQRARQESFTAKVIVEEFIEGVEVSVETISWEGNHYILAITDKVTTGNPYFVELEHHQPSALPNEIQQRIKFQTIKTLDALGICYGASHAEFKITSEGEVFAIETGARMGGDFIGSDLVYLSTGFDFLKAVIDVAFGDFSVPHPVWSKYSGVYFLSEETKKLLPVLKNATNFDYIRRSEIQQENLKQIRCSADRSGYLIYQSDKKIIL